MNELIVIKQKKDSMIYKIFVIFVMLFMIGITYKITYKKVVDKKIEFETYATKIEFLSENTNKYYIKVNYLANTITIYEKNRTRTNTNKSNDMFMWRCNSRRRNIYYE